MDTELRVGIAGDVWALVFEMFWCQVAICLLLTTMWERCPHGCIWYLDPTASWLAGVHRD
jgi:hypothetical protein